MTLVKQVAELTRCFLLCGDENFDGETGVWVVLVGEEMVEELGWVCGVSALEGGGSVTLHEVEEDTGEA